MNNRLWHMFLILMFIGQVAIARYFQTLRFNVDLLFLVIFFISIKSGFIKSMISASLIGFCSDYLSGGIMGVFSFSRTLAAYFLNTLARFVDLKNKIFIFLLVFISLLLSNLIAFIFYSLILKYNIIRSPASANSIRGLLIYQPFFTASVGTIILGLKKVKSLLDVS